MRSLALATDGVEDIELSYPRYRLIEEGIEVDIATPGGKEIQGKIGYVFEPDLELRDADPADYDHLLLPGGRSPERLRLEEGAASITKEFWEGGKFISAICHGPQLLISADVLGGVQATCYPSIQPDLSNAGARYVDEAVVVDGKLVTSRAPDDLPDFMSETTRKLVRSRVKD